MQDKPNNQYKTCYAYLRNISSDLILPIHQDTGPGPPWPLPAMTKYYLQLIDYFEDFQ